MGGTPGRPEQGNGTLKEGVTMSRRWRYRRDGQECGPVTSADLKMLVTSGALQRTDQVCREGKAQWVPASAIKGLFDGGVTEGPLASMAEQWRKIVLMIAGLLVLVTLLVGFLIFVFHRPAPVVAADPAPKHLLAALEEMREARAELRGTGHGPGRRHIERASSSLEKAIEQTEKALRDASVDIPAEAPRRDGDQKFSDRGSRQMRRAISKIQAAHAEIKFIEERHERTLRELREAAEQVESALLEDRRDGRDDRGGFKDAPRDRGDFKDAPRDRGGFKDAPRDRGDFKDAPRR
jgi:hypothetical protein